MTKRCEGCGAEIEDNEVVCEECYTDEEESFDDQEEWPDDEEE